MTVIADAPTYPHGYVVGRYLTAVADTVADADRLMDFTPAKGKVVFTPERGFRTADGPVPTFVVQRPVECLLDDQGYLTSPGGGRGVGLIVGVYLVRFEVQGATVPGPTRIEVREDHTEATPLDLILAMPEIVPPGTVVVVDETTAQRAEAAAARAEAIVTDLEGAVREVVASDPDLRGEPGGDGADGVSIVDVTADAGVATVSLSDGTVRLIDLPPGEAGHTPVPSWEGTALSWDGGPAVDLRGPAGPPGEPGADSTVSGPPGEPGAPGAPGPAPQIRIGTVTSGTTPSATITGTSPDLTLGLVLPKGDPGGKGDPGAPGALANASSYVIVGPGRPDAPTTTAGAIPSPDTTPVGAEYRSTDGASVGAWVWRKRPGGTWAVTDGDTGWRNVSDLLLSPWTTSTVPLIRVRRVGETAFLHIQYSAKPVPSGAVFVIPTGFRGKGGGVNAGIASSAIIGQYNNTPIGSGATSYQNVNGNNTVYTNGASEGGASSLAWSVVDAWPTAPLPGNPA